MQLQSPFPGRSAGSLASGAASPPSLLTDDEALLGVASTWERSRWHQTEAPDTAPPPLGEVLQRFRAHQRRQDGVCSAFGPGPLEPPALPPGPHVGQAEHPGHAESAKAAAPSPPGAGFSGTHPMGLPPTPDAALSGPVQVQFREAWQGLQVRELDSLALFNHFFGGWPR